MIRILSKFAVARINLLGLLSQLTVCRWSIMLISGKVETICTCARTLRSSVLSSTLWSCAVGMMLTWWPLIRLASINITKWTTRNHAGTHPVLPGKNGITTLTWTAYFLAAACKNVVCRKVWTTSTLRCDTMTIRHSWGSCDGPAAAATGLITNIKQWWATWTPLLTCIIVSWEHGSNSWLSIWLSWILIPGWCWCSCAWCANLSHINLGTTTLLQEVIAAILKVFIQCSSPSDIRRLVYFGDHQSREGSMKFVKSTFSLISCSGVDRFKATLSKALTNRRAIGDTYKCSVGDEKDGDQRAVRLKTRRRRKDKAERMSVYRINQADLGTRSWPLVETRPTTVRVRTNMLLTEFMMSRRSSLV